MDKDLEKIKEIFLSSDVDQESYEENLKQINEWEQGMRQSEDFISWQENDVTKQIIARAKESYKTISMQLILNRELSERDRFSIYAKQDAITWLISLVAKDAKNELETIQNQIKAALSVQ
jgi:hypothetical protein